MIIVMKETIHTLVCNNVGNDSRLKLLATLIVFLYALKNILDNVYSSSP